MEIQSVGFLLVKATVVLLTGMAVAAALRRAAAGTRHVVWLITVVSVLALPAVSLTSLRLRMLPAVPAPAATEAPATPADAFTEAQPNVAAPAAAEWRPAPRREASPIARANAWPRPSAVRILFVAWAAVALALLGRLAAGLLAVRRIVRAARLLEGPAWESVLCDAADRMGLAELPRLVASDRVDMPFACGLWRGSIVLPASAAGWSDERRRLVLFHELAHMRRRDLPGHLLGRLACAVYWFHPLVWTAARRLRAESEKACDDLVLASGTRPSDYAGHLLEILTTARRPGALSAAVAMARRTEFEGRMLAILDPGAPRGMQGGFRSAALTGALALLFLGVAALAPSQPRPATSSALESVSTAETAQVREQPPQPSQPSSPANRSSRRPEREARVMEPGDEQEAGDVEEDAEEGESRPDPEQTALLVRVLRTDDDANVRRSAAWALASSGGAAGVEALMAALKADGDDRVREMAAWGLADAAGEGVSAALAATLQSDRNEEVRAVAAWALGQRQANTAALEAAAADRAGRVRESAIWALGNQGLKKAPAPVIAALRDAEAPVRVVAAWMLGHTADPAAAPALRAAFKDEKDDRVREALFHALILVGERSPDVIVQVLESKDPDLRARAVQMMTRHRGPWPWPWPRPDPRPMP